MRSRVSIKRRHRKYHSPRGHSLPSNLALKIANKISFYPTSFRRASSEPKNGKLEDGTSDQEILLTLSNNNDEESLYSSTFKVDPSDPVKCTEAISQEISFALSEDGEESTMHGLTLTAGDDTASATNTYSTCSRSGTLGSTGNTVTTAGNTVTTSKEDVSTVPGKHWEEDSSAFTPLTQADHPQANDDLTIEVEQVNTVRSAACAALNVMLCNAISL